MASLNTIKFRNAFKVKLNNGEIVERSRICKRVHESSVVGQYTNDKPLSKRDLHRMDVKNETNIICKQRK